MAAAHVLDDFKSYDPRTDREKELQNKIDSLQAELRTERDARHAKEVDFYRKKFDGKFVEEYRSGGGIQKRVFKFHIDEVVFVGHDFVECKGQGYELSDSDLYDPMQKQTLFSFRFYDGGKIRVSKDNPVFITKEDYVGTITKWANDVKSYANMFISLNDSTNKKETK